MKPPTDKRLIALAAFFKRHTPALRRWPRKDLLAMLEWYWRDARVGIVMAHGKIVAAALARCIDHPDQAKSPWWHDESGQIVWIENIASKHPSGITALLNIACQRFGPKKAFSGSVFKRNGELRMLPWNSVLRLSQAA